MLHRTVGFGSGPSLPRRRQRRGSPLSCAVRFPLPLPSPTAAVAKPDWVESGVKSPRFGAPCSVAGVIMCPEPLAGRRVMIDGVFCDLVADGKLAMAEAFVTVATTPRSPGER